MNSIKIRKWRSPASEYPRARVGSARIATSWYYPGVYHAHMTRGYEYFVATKRLYITTLKIYGKTWMVDDPPHWWAMEDHAKAFEGHVVCAGLGLGLMVHAMDANQKIDRITVVERNQDVIELVEPLIPHRKLEIINSDWWGFNPTTISPIDGVLFDLFVGDAHNLFGTAVQATMDAYQRWNNLDLNVRVHGFPNPLIGDIGRALAANPTISRIQHVAFQP